jgi:hypothetical protein
VLVHFLWAGRCCVAGGSLVDLYVAAMLLLLPEICPILAVVHPTVRSVPFYAADHLCEIREVGSRPSSRLSFPVCRSDTYEGRELGSGPSSRLPFCVRSVVASGPSSRGCRPLTCADLIS